MNKYKQTKAIVIPEVVHQKLKEHCRRYGMKIGAAAGQLILTGLHLNKAYKESKN